MEYIEIEFRSVENKEGEELNFWKHVDNTEKSKTITLCLFLNFLIPFRTWLFFTSWKWHNFYWMKVNIHTEILEVKSSQREASPVPFWRTALSHDPSTEREDNVDNGHKGASFNERRNSQALRKPISKSGDLVLPLLAQNQSK